MNKSEIKSILNKKYNRENWKLLTKQIFKNVNFFQEAKKIDVKNDKILDFVQIGNVTLSDKKVVSLFELKLIKNLNIYKNKIELRNIVTKFIDQFTNHGVLVIFDNQGTDYRLTFSSKYSELDEFGKLIEVETSSKRYSYLLGENESCSTPSERLYLLSKSSENLKIKNLLEAFNVDKVTREFFNKYRDLYLDLADNISNIITKNQDIKNDFKKNNLNEFDFSKKLLALIVFVYFLQKKGLLGIKKNSDGTFNRWGSGPKNFLRKLFNKEYVEYKNFFDEILEPLFFESLSTERKDDYFSYFKCKIPFLNGGLFEKFYNWSGTQIVIKNEIFEKILDTFDQYNFTIQEEDPLDKEVAIDPEMLGKIFESLIEVTERKQEGIFYTPKEVVEYKCKESLKYYILNEFNKKNIKVEDYKINEILSREIYEIEANFDEKKIHFIYEKLKNVKICDPAIGSGAFPLGILNILVFTIKKLRKYLKKKNTSDYFLKKKLIQNCIYGVDKNYSSVEIAKLRLWLTLVIEENSLDHIEPLPNLDYKIVQGNSLIGVEHNLLNDYLVNKFDELKNKFYSENNFKKKEEIKEKIDKIKSELNIKNNFDFELNFHEIFSSTENNNFGFDIVIANPPYLGEKNNKEIFREIKSGKLKEYYEGKMDLFYFFFHQGINLLKDGGVLCFITTNYFITALGGRKLRDDLNKRTEIKKLINFKELKIFESAKGQHNLITILKKNKSENKSKINIINCNSEGVANNYLLNSIFNEKNLDCEYVNVSNKDIYEGNEYYIRLSGHPNSNSSIANILNKISNKNFPLKIYANIKQGIVSGADKVTDKHLKKYKIKAKKGEGIFVLSHSEIKSLKLNVLEKKIIKHFYKNSDISRFNINLLSDNNLIYINKDTDISKHPNILKHLERFKVILKNKRETIEKKIPWYSLHWSRNLNILENLKIVCPRRSKLNNFALEKGKSFEQSDIMMIAIKDKYKKILDYNYLLGILNSKLIYFWLYYRGKVKGNSLELYGKPLEELPLKIFEDNISDNVIKIVKKLILKFNYAEFDKLNYLIYKIFKLSKEEINIVEEIYSKIK